MNIISDGNSSVLQEYGRRGFYWVVIKNNWSVRIMHARALVADNPQNKGYHKLSKYMRQRLTSSVRCAIKSDQVRKTNRQQIRNLNMTL